MPFDKFPYTNFHELNLDYFIQHFKQIFAEWAELYDTMLAWKAATDEENAAWKTQTEADIGTWETGVLDDLDVWKAAFQELFDETFSNLEEIKTAAEDARDAAEGFADDAEAAAESVEASAAQIETNRVRAINSFALKSSDMSVVTDGTDFDDITTPGNYRVQTSEIMATMSHSPVSTGARIVVSQDATTTVVTQLLFASDSLGSIWARTKIPSGWRDWMRISPVDTTLSTANAPADAATVGAYAQLAADALTLTRNHTTSIPTGTDFNNLTTAGNYRVVYSADMQTMSNTPTTAGGRVFVMQGPGSDVTYQFVFADESTPALYMRYCYSGTWKAWQRLAPTDTTLNTTNAPADAASLKSRTLMTYTGNCAVIPNNTDFDTLTEPGNYCVQTGANMATMTNSPVTSAAKLFVTQGATSSVLFQFLFVSDNTQIMYYRFKSSSRWYEWHTVADYANLITPENVSITSGNIDTYFPNRKMSDAPANTIYRIAHTNLFSDAPVGNGRIVTSLDDAGDMSGALITLSAYRNKTGTNADKVQMFLSYRSASYSPVLAYRVATVSSGAYVWSNWAKFEQNGYVHASNQVIYGGSLDVAPFTDLNDAPMNSIYQLDLNLNGSDAAHTLAHHPEPGVSSVVMTYAYSYTSRHGMVQTLFNLRGRMYWRYGYQQSEDEYRWTDWRLVNPDVPPIPAPPTTAGTYSLSVTVDSQGDATYTWS